MFFNGDNKELVTADEICNNKQEINKVLIVSKKEKQGVELNISLFIEV